MTDITDLAKEILRLESDARLLYSPDLTIDLFKTYPLLAACISCKAVELAQMVIDQEGDFQDYKEVAMSSCACKFERDLFNGNSKLVESCKYHADKIDQARQEQKEKDAQIVEARGKEIGGAIDPVRTAKAIRES